ncbi:MAG: hypothetical protein K2X32_15320 [Phycisphaerales bacterium]|nr:hypothetical protein [Phycisphaerales bacterium]
MTAERRQRRTLARALAYALGLALLIGAGFVVAQNASELSRAAAAASRASTAAIVAMLVLPLINWLLTSGVLLTLTRRYGRVPASDMHLLVGASWLLNYLPLKPGLFGRVAYHKLVHNIAVRDSVRVMFTALACSAGAVMIFLAWTGCLGFALSEFGGGKSLGVFFASVLLIAPAMLAWGQGLSEPRGPEGTPGATILIAVLLRLGDIGVWSLRFSLAFSILGQPQPAMVILAIAAATQASSLLPIQIGLSEWVCGLTLGAFAIAATPAGEASNVSTVLALGLSAGLLNRAAELVAALPIGLASMAILAKRKRIAQPTAPSR